MTAELLAWRFGVSVQQANARVRRLAAAGLVRRSARGVGQAYAVALTRKGARAVGLPERRAPRTDAQREHELAIVRTVGELERQVEAGDEIAVWTERECRERQQLGLAEYALKIRHGGQPELRRPDVVIERGDRRTAVELEFSPKAPSRLWRILARSIARFLRHVRQPIGPPMRAAEWCQVSVAPWWGAPDDVKAAVRAAIAEPGKLTERERRWR